MLIRIVKMSFKEENITAFLALFEEKKHLIRHFDGCLFLELYRDKHNKNIFFTYSHWAHESNLEAYRNSETFKGIWEKTKVLFNDKPQAWSVDNLVSLP